MSTSVGQRIPAGGTHAAVTPEKIMQIGLGFWGSKALLSAIELGVFTYLASGPLTGDELTQAAGLHPRGSRDFFDALVAMNMLNRHDGCYSNTHESNIFLDKNKPSYIGGILEMANARLYSHWGSLTEGLRTGKPQNESNGTTDGDTFDALYSDPQRLRTFLSAMTGISMPPAIAIARKFPWNKYQTFVDVGTAQGGLSTQVALAHDHITGKGFDLPIVQPIFEEYVHSFGLHKRLTFQPGNFFEEQLPGADVLVMGHILHDWNLEQKMTLLSKAVNVLPKGGSLIVYESLIDDDRRHNAFGLLMSLNMLIETQGGFDYTGADCCGWMRRVGFTEAYVEHLVGPDSMVVGIK
ncbi:MAG: methyltransferase [Acidobacteria bacterium]|nr:MAG: methyltransferase [Acidobacteriota bacterium]